MKRLAAFAAALPIALAALPGDALACFCAPAIAAHRSATDANRDRNAERLLQAVRDGVGQTTAYIDKAIAAAEKIGDSGNMNDSLRSRDEFRARAEGGRYDPPASACGGLSAASELAAAPAAPPEGQAAQTGADAQNRSRNYERCAGSRAEVCEGPGAVAAAIIEDRDRHRSSAGLLDPTSDLRALLDQPTAGAGTGISPEDLSDALWRLTQNVVNPFPGRPVTESEASTPAGRIAIAERQSEAARRSAPAGLLGWLQTRSAPNLPLGDWARRTAPPGYPYPIDDRISVRQYYDIAVAASWRNPDWQKRVAAMSPEAAIRELVLQQALANDLAHMRLELDFLRAANDAVVASILLDGGDG